MTTFNRLTGAVYFCLSMVIMVSCQKELTPEKMGLDNSTLRITNSTLSAKAALGRKIYFDNNFSSPSLTQSCSSCHLPGQGFTGKGNVAPSLTNAPNTPRGFLAGIGEGAVKGSFGGRKPPSAAYATFAPAFHFDAINQEYVGGLFWDGRATGEVTGTTAGDQALEPFLADKKHNVPSQRAVLQIIANDAAYQALWKAAWGSNLTISRSTDLQNYRRVGLSIGEFEASPEVNQFCSRFDAWLRAGSPENGGGILSRRELDGMALFQEAECDKCHDMEANPGEPGPLFTEFSYANIGLPSNMDFINQTPTLGNAPSRLDNGLLGFLLKRGESNLIVLGEAEGAFKIPTLRNVAKGEGNKRFMHNGVLRSLKEVVHFYNTRDLTGPTREFPSFIPWAQPEFDASKDTKRVGNLGLSSADEDLIVEFMRTLTDGYSKPTVTPAKRVL